MDGFEPVGYGLTVYQDERLIEGPVRWLDSPAAVIDFVRGGRVSDTIVLARGGTTTFLTPALTHGVKAVLTLQGAPESHLGILCREYGIPCLMSVSFSDGASGGTSTGWVRSGRGEVIPADGTIVRLDVSTAPRGRVLAEPGALSTAGGDGQSPAAADIPGTVDDDTGAAAEQAAQLQRLLESYLGDPDIPHGQVGDQRFRRRITTDVLLTGDDSRDLDRAELNDLLGYLGFNVWDALAARATEGESGLIPRQEYEALGAVQIWQRYPEMIRFITEQVGVDGLHEIGGTSRREIGTKANLLHMWCVGLVSAFGRGLSMSLGRLAPNERERDLRDALQFMRRLQYGLWDGPGEPLFTSMRGYAAPILADAWTDRFRDELVSISDPEVRSRYQRFSATSELMGFLLHFDNRCGLHDTGPYPTGDGGFMLVRDHFLSDDLYHWADVAEGLPHAITQAMYFRPDAPLEVALYDIGTTFTKPANYLRHLTGMAVYARDRWDTPLDEVRLLDDTEIDTIQASCRDASDRLYRRIAGMPRRDKIMAGAQVYYTDFIAPFARAAGLWDRLQTEFDFFEVDPLASAAYYDLVKDDNAATLVPRLLLTGAICPPVPEPVTAAWAMPALHLLAVRGCCPELPVDARELTDAGLVSATPAGYLLTEAGRSVHARELDDERATYDNQRLAQAYARFLAQNVPLKSVISRWQSLGEHDDDARAELAGELGDIVGRVRAALRRTSEQLPRFEGYQPRLSAALARVEQGEHEYLAGVRVDSVHTVWMQLHEDYLLTQGITRESEGSY